MAKIPAKHVRIVNIVSCVIAAVPVAFAPPQKVKLLRYNECSHQQLSNQQPHNKVRNAKPLLKKDHGVKEVQGVMGTVGNMDKQ